MFDNLCYGLASRLKSHAPCLWHRRLGVESLDALQLGGKGWSKMQHPIWITLHEFVELYRLLGREIGEQNVTRGAGFYPAETKSGRQVIPPTGDA